MKATKIFKTLITGFFLIAVLVSCSSDDEIVNIPPPSSQTIAEIAIGSSELNELVKALQLTDLVDVLNGTDEYTVFAPTDDAFSAFLEANDFASLEDVPVDILENILLNHVVVGEFFASDLSTGYINTLATQSDGFNLSMFVKISASIVSLNGVSNVSIPNINASNGVVHVVDSVIGIPTVVTFALADEATFSTLATALTTLTPGTDFAGVLSRTEGGNGDMLNPPFTVFAPTNQAFTDLGTPPEESTLTQVLLHHVVGGANVQSSGLNQDGDTSPTTLQGTNLTITLPGTGGNIANVTDSSGNNDIGIIAVNVQAGNGVIHVLNKVAIPALP